jgi:hypothetical protein
MANRNWASGGKLYSMHVKPVMVDATIQIGAAGAVSSFVGSTVASAVEVSTGIYKIKLQSGTNFNKLYFAAGSAQSPSSGLSGVMAIEIQNAPNASIQLASGAELTVKCLDAAGALVEPASGSAINVMMICSDSSVLIQGE